jgi:hypothetical protein
MLSAAKHLAAQRYKTLRFTQGDNGGADVSRKPPIDRPSVGVSKIQIILLSSIIAPSADSLSPIGLSAIHMKQLICINFP